MIDEATQKMLRAKYNPENSDLRKMQIWLLEMLKYIDKICCENNIKYWISSGTCLGAVRHGGFIPWDDDIDIEMLKEDYELFKEIVIKDNKYKIQDYKSDRTYYFRFPKLRNESIQIVEAAHGKKRYRYNGIYIDVFLMEFSSSLKIHKLGWFLLYFCNFKLNKIIKNDYMRHTIAQSVLTFSRLILKPLQSIGYKKQLRHCSPGAYSKGRNPDNIFPTKRIKFENIYVNVPGNYEQYLKDMFGDYEKLPTNIHTHGISVNS